PIRLPALRHRPGDIPMLARHFIDKYNRKLNKRIEGITEDALAALAGYSWPGNIRELENSIERVLLFADGPMITVADLPSPIRASPQLTPAPGLPAGSAPATAGSPPPPPAEPLAAPTEGGLKDLVRARAAELERDLIIRALEETGGNVTRAAKLLQISRKSLQTKMKEFGLRGEAGEE
ncbi:MAG TPA: helix-turn-helix domain-containing protein, partial [Myxococcaceae bacterium]|nr:helix-turn-helix domain-containing protein [Myxococcaceae bacterium]